MTLEEIQAGLDSGDMNIINGILNKTIVPEEPQAVQSVVETVEPVTEVKPEPVIEVDPYKEEIERQRRYTEMVEQRNKEEKEEYLRKLKAQEDALNKEKQAKEEILNRLQQLESMRQSTTVQSTQPNPDENEEDEAYVSEYTKRTRQMVEELRNSVGSDNPAIKQINDELTRLKQEYEAEKEQKRSYEEQKRKDKLQEQLFDNIRQFQLKYPELQTERNVKELNDGYAKFRKDISYISGAKSVPELEKAIADYYANGEIKKLADEKGISPVQEYDKFIRIMELMDLKDGIKFDPKSGEYVPIVDDSGAQIRYRSLEEAYIVQNHINELNKARRQAYSDVNKKLTTLNNAPVTLRQEQTSTFDSGLTVDQMQELISLPEQKWVNDPNLRVMVENAYRTLGLEPPKVRARRF